VLVRYNSCCRSELTRTERRSLSPPVLEFKLDAAATIGMSPDGTTRLRSVIDDLGLGGVFGNRTDTASSCGCTASFDDETLVLDATDCDGDLENATACRRTAIEALAERAATRIIVRSNGLERRYADRGVDLLESAGRFISLLASATSGWPPLRGTRSPSLRRSETSRTDRRYRRRIGT